MKIQNKFTRVIGIPLFIFGVVIGMMFIGISVFGDFESYFFVAYPQGKVLLDNLKCPMIITSQETGSISILIDNPTNDKITPSVWVQYSKESIDGVLEEDRRNLTLAPGETEHLEWDISAENSIYGDWVLFRIYAYSQYPLPTGGGSCGVFVLDLPGLTGDQVSAIGLFSSILSMGIGYWLWFVNHKPIKGKQEINSSRAMVLMAGFVLAGLITIFIGSYLWILSAGIFIIGVLLFLLVFLQFILME